MQSGGSAGCSGHMELYARLLAERAAVSSMPDIRKPSHLEQPIIQLFGRFPGADGVAGCCMCKASISGAGPCQASLKAVDQDAATSVCWVHTHDDGTATSLPHGRRRRQRWCSGRPGSRGCHHPARAPPPPAAPAPHRPAGSAP